MIEEIQFQKILNIKHSLVFAFLNSNKRILAAFEWIISIMCRPSEKTDGQVLSYYIGYDKYLVTELNSKMYMDMTT